MSSSESRWEGYWKSCCFLSACTHLLWFTRCEAQLPCCCDLGVQARGQQPLPAYNVFPKPPLLARCVEFDVLLAPQALE